MRLSANVLQSAEQRTNPLGEREILLRSLAIPSIEHLAVTRDQFDVIDLSNNHLSRLENFPKLERLNCLYLGGNGIDCVDGTNLKRNLPCLRTLILTGNGIRGWNVIGDLGSGCPKLEFLSLVGNPVTSKSCSPSHSFFVVPIPFRAVCVLFSMGSSVCGVWLEGRGGCIAP
jgi:U2 small nuclear ribonucleoprotein A'